MDLNSIARLLVAAGLVLLLLGGLVFVAARIGLPLGRLPGDIRIETGGVTCFFPLVTMILVSVILTILLNVLIRLGR
jgi:hypothetical protein